MKSVSAKLVGLSSRVVLLILALVPFHALLTVWLGSALGMYEASRLWKDVLILALVPAAVYTVLKDRGLCALLKKSVLFWLIAAYAVLHLLLGAVAYVRGDVNLTALAYALDVNLRFLAFFAICFIVTVKTGWLRERLPMALLIPAAVVVLFGLAQLFILPIDALTHFGYGPETIAPFQTVDQKTEYLRVQSTLRGSNPLGAYLVVIAAAVAAMIAAHRKSRQAVIKLGVFLVATLTVLGFTYSRSAYIGVVIALLVLGWLLANVAVRRWLLVGLAALTLVSAGVLAVFKDNDRLQNVLFHTDEHSQSADSSNEARLGAQKQALDDVAAEPLGRGPGTAGPASQHNDGQPVRISENYFLQLGQETGWLGVGLFVAILVFVWRSLWAQRRTPLGAALLASLLGLTFVNLVSHAWTDDTLSLIWWGVAGVVLAPAILNKSKQNETR